MKLSLFILLSVFRTIVLPVQFQDRQMSYEQSELRAILDNAQSYLDTQFRGTVTFKLDLSSPVTLSKTAAYYGKNGETEKDLMIHEAVIAACRASEVEDFSYYDNDGDGKADLVIILTAGPSEADGAGEDEIWPSFGYLSRKGVAFRHKNATIDCYADVTELKSTTNSAGRLNGPGDLCHEICHAFDLPDFYDTDGIASGGTSSALWKSTSIMDEGNRNNFGQTPPNFNAIELELLGLGKADTLKKGFYTLKPIDSGSRYLKAQTDEDGLYLLMECRKAEGWDSYIGGEGLITYVVDKRDSKKWKENRINCDPSNQCARPVEPRSGAKSVKDLFLPSSAQRHLCLSEYGINLALLGISTDKEGNVSFCVVEPLTIRESISFQDAASLSWETDPMTGDVDSFFIVWNAPGEKSNRKNLGKNKSVMLEGLSPQTRYDYILGFTNTSGEEFCRKGSFTTKSKAAGVAPFILFDGSERREDGSFVQGTGIPLRVFNLPENSSAEWTMDGKAISRDASGYYKLQSSGTLRAVIRMPDGSRKILMKEITVR